MRYLIVLLCWFCANAVAVDDAGYGVIAYDDFHVNHVSTGDSYSKVISRFGKPLREESVDMSESVRLYYKGVYISLFEGEVGEIVVSSADFAVKGIRVGFSVSDALRMAGDARPITVNGRTSLRYRCVAKNGLFTDAELRLFFERDKISEISLWFPTT